MKTGTKSLLFGVHQVFWHPFTVWLAWIWLFHQLPNWRETICIVMHDWGYLGKRHMDDECGERHPELGAALADCLFDDKYYANLCLCHSRHYSRQNGMEPSMLCWADKASIKFDPWWLYLPRAWLTGELAEYRRTAIVTGFCPPEVTNRHWYNWIRERQLKIATSRRGDVVDYNPSEEFLRNVKSEVASNGAVKSERGRQERAKEQNLKEVEK